MWCGPPVVIPPLAQLKGIVRWGQQLSDDDDTYVAE